MSLMRTIEELSLNAWPAENQLLVDGWLVRIGDGFTRRANSVSPLYPGTIPVRERISRCEALYRARGQPVIFKITPMVHPPDLDATLDLLGYKAEAPTEVRVLDNLPIPDGPVPVLKKGELQAVEGEKKEGPVVWQNVDPFWVSHYRALSGLPSAQHVALTRLLKRIPCQTGFAALYEEGKVVGCGLGVVQETYLGLFDITTAKSMRGKGVGNKLMQALMAWGWQQGARQGYLQVEKENKAAKALYDKLGFKPLYDYCYRVHWD